VSAAVADTVCRVMVLVTVAVGKMVADADLSLVPDAVGFEGDSVAVMPERLMVCV
jgi:hypothetical protein